MSVVPYKNSDKENSDIHNSHSPTHTANGSSSTSDNTANTNATKANGKKENNCRGMDFVKKKKPPGEYGLYDFAPNHFSLLWYFIYLSVNISRVQHSHDIDNRQG